MEISGSTALVIGADGGIGTRIVEQMRQRGARKIYGGVLKASGRADYIEVEFDITNTAAVYELARQVSDINLVINASGFASHAPLEPLEALLRSARREFEINCLGQLSTASVLAPVIESNGGGTIVNTLSIAALVANPIHISYAASKAAAWSVTNALRLAFFPRGVHVTGVFLGFTDTPMAAELHPSAPMNDPSDIATRILDGVEANEYEILCDQRSIDVKTKISNDIEELYLPQLQAKPVF
jgi:NAD(P)-dependent dehydrogenase (short-subunit alcohol dehydrogenase family)